MTNKKRFLLIGWDAADWKILNPMIDKGLMPNLEKLINGGTISNLATLDPPYSPMLWTSMATGKRPYNHGVLGFSEPTPDGKKVRPVMSLSRSCKAIWNMLSEEDFKTHVVGWWPSHPAEKINGIMVSNFFQNHVGPIHEEWPMPKGTVYPNEMSDWFSQFRVHPQEINGKLLQQFIPKIKDIDQKNDKRFTMVAKVTAHATSLNAAFTNIIRTQDWDFAALYLDAIDHYCHGFMKYHPPQRPHISKSDFDLYNFVVTAGYRYHDMMLGNIMNLIDDHTTLMLVSDHGFQPDHLRPRQIPNEPAGPAYEHSPYGVLVAKGPNIKKDHITYGTSILDLTPTILHCLDLPVGKDMDGRIMTNIFEKQKEIKLIDSWESKGNVFKNAATEIELSEDESNAVLEQLEELGYVEKQNEDSAKQLKQTKDECQFNLARAYADGGKLQEAIKILELLHKENPNTARYSFRLALCYQSVGEFAKARGLVNLMKEKELYDSTTLDVFEGTLLVAEKQPLKAIKLFKGVETSVDKYHSRLHLQMAKCHLMLHRYADAKSHLQKEIAMDYDSADAHYLLGRVNLFEKYYEKAANAFITAVGLNFNEPHYHADLGKALFALGQYEDAAMAWENSIKILPSQPMVVEKLVQVYQNKLNQVEKATLHKAWLDNLVRPIIYIVSGLPRSGTSMMMQMMEKGGLPIFTDKVRAADENNPKGYYEHEAVKNLARSNKIIFRAKNKAVKVVANLIKFLPSNFEYKIIFMERPIEEVMASQSSMLARLGKKKKSETFNLSVQLEYEKQLKTMKQWIDTKSNMHAIYVDYHDCIKNPFEQSIQINEFLDFKLLPELMASCVDPNLYREKQIVLIN